MAVDWDSKFEYLRASRSLYHNRDYWEFLVRTVWRLDDKPQRVVDFGCGFGWLGLFLMPMLAPGSTYTGFDSSEALLAKGRELLAGLPYRAQLLHGDVHSAPLDDDAFDVAITHTVMMHVADPEKALAEMIRVTRHGGMVIACEGSRNAANALLHIHETDEQEDVPLSMLQAMNASIRRRTGVDHNIGMKMPVLMHKAGLHHVQARTGDAVRLLLPPIDTPDKERLFSAICNDGLGNLPSDDEGIRKWKQLLLDRGASEAEAEAEIRREIERDFGHKGRSYHTAYPGLLTFSFGTVCRGI
ncbi:MAG: class I SAM-dependent methyltransferase [Verrucomicrobia bacterium]|nr:class I SAM-dependent methyltransferase [Verrucomicrobiota bacterium]